MLNKARVVIIVSSFENGERLKDISAIRRKLLWCHSCRIKQILYWNILKWNCSKCVLQKTNISTKWLDIVYKESRKLSFNIWKALSKDIYVFIWTKTTFC